jgi:hypothetical protein
VRVRGYTNTEQITGGHTTNADRTLATSTIPITDVPVRLVVSTDETSVSRGECYVKVSIRAEGVVIALLGCGYITDTSTIEWPGGLNEGSTQGPGLIRTITGTDPAAGVEISETVPTGALWRLKLIRNTLVTDATVASRVEHLLFDDGANILWESDNVSAQAASLTITQSFSEAGVRVATSVGNVVNSIPPDNRLAAGYRIRTLTNLLKAGDNFGPPQYEVEEWIEP